MTNHEQRDEALALFEDAAEDQDIGTDKLGELGKLVRQQIDLEDQIAKKEAETKALKKQLQAISQETIPALMLDEIQMKELRLEDGSRVTVKDSISVATTGKWREAINQWLTEIDEADLIKDEITVGLGRGQGETAQAIIQNLTELQAQFNRKQYVAPQSLAALIRELLDQGQDVDLERIGAFTYRTTKIDRPKKG